MRQPRPADESGLRADAHRQQHIAFRDRAHRVEHVRIQKERLALVQLLLCAGRVDLELPPETMNDDLTRSSMLGEFATGFEREEHQAQGAAMDQTRLAMPMDRWVRLCVQATR
jgi:hypothetical protein